MTIIKHICIIVAIHGASCRFSTPTLGWKRDLYVTWKKAHNISMWLNDTMGNAEKWLIANVTEELTRDSRLKARQISDIKKDTQYQVGFNVGLIIGKIREKYRNMLEIYREAQDHRHDRLISKHPAICQDRVEHYFFYFELIRKYELHIDHLVHVVEGIPEHEWAGSKGLLKKTVYSSQRPYGRRSNKLDQFGHERGIIAEQKLKKNMRQKFLMKKMGRPQNASTSQKRFVNQWPVVNTWNEYFANMY